MRSLKWTETQKAEDIVSDPIPASAGTFHASFAVPGPRPSLSGAASQEFAIWTRILEIKSKYEYVLIWFVLTDAGPKYEPATRQQ